MFRGEHQGGRVVKKVAVEGSGVCECDRPLHHPIQDSSGVRCSPKPPATTHKEFSLNSGFVGEPAAVLGIFSRGSNKGRALTGVKMCRPLTDLQSQNLRSNRQSGDKERSLNKLRLLKCPQERHADHEMANGDVHKTVFDYE